MPVEIGLVRVRGIIRRTVPFPTSWLIACAASGLTALAGAAQSQPASVSERPTAVIPDLEVTSISGARLLPGGRVVFVDSPSRNVLVYSEGGDELARFGRAGRGPGTFQWPLLVPGFRSADSVAIGDPALGRVTFFSPSGELLGTEQAIPQGEVRGRILGVSSQGVPVVGLKTNRTETGLGGTLSVFVGTRDGGPVAVAQDDSIVVTSYQGRRTYSGFDFLPKFVSAFWNDQVAVVDEERSEIRIASLSGGLDRVLPLPIESRTLTRAQYERVYERELRRVPEAARAQTEQFYRAIFTPWPVRTVNRMFFSTTGDLWLQEYSFGDPGRWWIYRADSGVHRPVDVPDGFIVLDADAHRVLGGTFDEFDVPSLEIRQLTQ